MIAKPALVKEYINLFVNRRAFTMQSMRPHPGSGRHYYYRPKNRECGAALHLTEKTISDHLEGTITIGLYAINPSNQRCKWVAIDADYKNAMEDLVRLQYYLTADQVDSALEMSKRGGHLWIFLAVPLLAKKCRIYIYDLARRLGVPVKGAGLAEGIEVFPRHDAISRKYTIHTSANFERSADQKLAAKVLVTCELTIFGLGSHSATGEEWADNANAGTAAEAQAFKRSCACFGLGRYLYYFTGTWVDLDDRKRPKSVPQLAGWATPAGWLEGLRPRCVEEKPSERPTAGNRSNGQHNSHGPGASGDRLREIERMEQVVGKRMYRGLLKSLARVWNPKDIQDPETQERVLAHLQAAERGLRRAESAREKVGLAAFAGILGSLRLSSFGQVDNLKTLQEIVVALEEAASRATK